MHLAQFRRQGEVNLAVPVLLIACHRLQQHRLVERILKPVRQAQPAQQCGDPPRKTDRGDVEQLCQAALDDQTQGDGFPMG